MISVIVPTYNEEKTILLTLKRLEELSGEFEIILVDGGSSDKTFELADGRVKLIQSEKGRASQMNAGAKVATGDILWFVHSDSILDVSSLEHIEAACLKGVDAGCFSLYFYDYNTPFMSFVAFTSNLRAKYLKLMFGDQGIFVKKRVFNKMSGYDEMPIMEDWDLSKRLYASTSVKVLSVGIGTSGRRFKVGGPLRTLLKMHYIKWLYLKGVAPEIIARQYKEIR